MALKIYNTYSRRLEEFVPIRPGKVSFYVCGPTVYDYFHIGNARCFVVFDVLRKYLEYIGLKVAFILNITDIDDKIINRAGELGISPQEVANKFMQAFFEDIDKLRIQRATVHPKATEHIAEMQDLINTLIQKGYAYRVNDDVYFEVGKFSEYGALSGKNIEELQSGIRVNIDQRKHNPLDFALWKGAKPGEPSWSSLWGAGRPGWHIECSAMATKYLGEEFDIHGGAEDLVFPHHENEIAQSKCASEANFARYWIHLGFLNINNEKMSKSLGNFLVARELLKQYRPEALRLFFLQKHYRSPINYTEESVLQAETAVERLYRGVKRLSDNLPEKNTLYPVNILPVSHPVILTRNEIREAMNNDFDTPATIAKIFDLLRWANTEMDRETGESRDINGLQESLNLFHEIDSFLGIIPLEEKRHSLTGLFDIWLATNSRIKELELTAMVSPHTDNIDTSDNLAILNLLMKIREDLRKIKQYSFADKIRKDLDSAGYILEDNPSGTKWRIK